MGVNKFVCKKAPLGTYELKCDVLGASANYCTCGLKFRELYFVAVFLHMQKVMQPCYEIFCKKIQKNGQDTPQRRQKYEAL